MLHATAAAFLDRLLEVGRGPKVMELTVEGIAGAEFVALAGSKYTEPLVQAGLSVQSPMKGLGIGRPLAWLTRALLGSRQQTGEA